MKKILLSAFLLLAAAPVYGLQTVFLDPSLGSCTDPAPANTGNGTCTVSSATGFVISETFTFLATTSGAGATFSVTGSVTGAHQNVTAGSLQAVKNTAGFTKFSVNLSNGGVAYAIGDNFQVTAVQGTQLRKSSFDLFDLTQVCANGCSAAAALTATNITGSGNLFIAGTAATGALTVSGVTTTAGVSSSAPVLVPVGSAAAPGIAISGDSDNGLYSIATNQIGLATAGVKTASFDDAGQCRFGNAQASQTNHAFYKDVNAGDTTTGVVVNIGNSGSGQGITSLEYNNAAATGAPSSYWRFSPRNNANSTNYAAGSFQFAKGAATNTSSLTLALYENAAGAATFANYFFNGTVPTLALGATAFGTTFDLNMSGVTGGEFRIYPDLNAGGGGFSLYSAAHASLANQTYFRNNAATSGIISSANRLTWRAGSSATPIAAVGGVLKNVYADVGNVGAGEDDLQTYTIPASVLSSDGDSIAFTAGGIFAANANSKTVKCYFGATSLVNTGPQTFNNGSWDVRILITRTGATTQRATAVLTTSLAALPTTTNYSTPAETLSGAIVIKCTGTATSDNDVVEKLSQVEFKPVGGG